MTTILVTEYKYMCLKNYAIRIPQFPDGTEGEAQSFHFRGGKVLTENEMIRLWAELEKARKEAGVL